MKDNEALIKDITYIIQFGDYRAKNKEFDTKGYLQGARNFND